MLIAASAILQEGYMIPIWQVLKDIIGTIGIEMSNFSLPTVNDTLTLASRFGNRRLMQALLDAGADASHIDEGSTQTWPAESNSRIFDALRARGADVSSLDKYLNLRKPEVQVLQGTDNKKAEELRGSGVNVSSLEGKLDQTESSSARSPAVSRWLAESSQDEPFDPSARSERRGGRGWSKRFRDMLLNP